MEWYEYPVDGLVHRFVINDEHETLDELIGQEFSVMSPVSYDYRLVNRSDIRDLIDR